MENQPQLDDPGRDLRSRNGAGTNLPTRPQYIEVPYREIIEEQGPGLLLEYWDILRRHKGTLVLIAFLGLLTALLLTLPQTPVYQARALLEIQNLNENFLNTREVNPNAKDGASYTPEYELQTQVKILQSKSLLGRVIAKLDLEKRLIGDKDRSRLSAWRKVLGLPETRTVSAAEEALSEVTRNLKVHTQPSTRIVEILYDSTDPKLAADITNTIATEFNQQNLEARWQTTQHTGEWLTRQMDDFKINLEKSDEQLQAYAHESGLFFTSEKDNVAEEQLRQLQQEVSRAQADRVARQSKFELVTKASPDSLPEVLDDATLKEYQVKLTDLRRQLAEVSSTLTAANPTVKKVQAQVATLESALEKARSNILGRLRNEFESAQRRENLLAADYAVHVRLLSEQSDKVTHYNILKREVDTNRQLYDSMLQHVKEAGIASALSASNVRVIDSAIPPTHPYKPNLILNSGLGLLVGAFLGIVFVVMRERADRSIQAPGETSLYLNVPELGVIPSAGAARKGLPYYPEKSKDTKGAGSVELVTSQRNPSLVADSFRSTLSSILFLGENGNRPRVIALTSAGQGEGKTTVASNLALALAEIGRRVLLIDADLRLPRLHKIFDAPNDWGLSDLLEGKEPPGGRETMLFGTKYPGLYLLPAGTSNGGITSLLHSPRLPEFLEKMRQEFDTILIDTPPMLTMPDARVLGRLAGAVILVVKSNGTTRETALAAKERLREDGTRVLGTILNQWDPRNTSHYSYGNQYYHYEANRD